jgi:Zn-dependent M28 family amino/carboxypeptidase
MQRKRWLTTLFVPLGFLLATSLAGAQDSGIRVSTPEEIQSDFVTVPCENGKRLAAVRSLFERAGAPPAEVRIDEYKNVENLIVIKKGESSEKIVLGAHYDKVVDGCGALDNWTGIVTLSHLYRTLKDIRLKKTIVFIAFGKEESSRVGSAAMMKNINDEQATEYCAMINIDSLGLAPPQVADNMSNKKLGEFIAELAKEMKMPFGHASIGADSDSSSFLARKIPAVTIHGMSNEWPDILHSSKDQASKVDHLSVYMGYRLILGIIATTVSVCELEAPRLKFCLERDLLHTFSLFLHTWTILDHRHSPR